ncbi:MAG: hypothetical protein HEQ19_18945 [Gloeotrichia echinulata CP02]|jgi:pSer/pThr/pTyr-binding forkhead associated (FHA) protein
MASPNENFDLETKILDYTTIENKAVKSQETTIIFNPETDNLETEVTPTPVPEENQFPPPGIWSNKKVSVQALHATGLSVEETEYAALGGGMGSFVWVDTIRIYGVKPDQIVVLGIESKPYARYKTLTGNSQIPLHERIRSGSDSCPDNIWGWPGYALREAWGETFRRGRLNRTIGLLWQVFAEPALADTYTPKLGNVFDSLDREAERISWDRMWRYGAIRSIRQTEDGRYAIAYSRSTEQRREHRFLIARYVHLAMGYPAIRFLPDLQAYRATTGDFKSVVNAYEQHEHIYNHLIRNGGKVVVRGRGIVASRVIQRLYEVRQQNPQVSIIHLMRSPKPEGDKFEFSQRYAENQWEFQPYNWPKGTWGGDMRSRLEAASPTERYKLLKAWDGTTTASRSDWRKMINDGLKEGWYTIAFGQVQRVERSTNGKPLTYITTNQGEIKVEADFIIDSTGLEAKPDANPLLKDLINHYNLPLNPFGRLDVANDFEMLQMRNDRSRMYASGVMTLGGPYAPVDTFLGLQYAAQRSADALVRSRAAKIHYLDGLGSLIQWIKWATNQNP